MLCFHSVHIFCNLKILPSPHCPRHTTQTLTAWPSGLPAPPQAPPPTRLLSEDLALHSFGPAVPTPGMPSASFLSSHPHPATSNPRGPVKPSSWYDPRCSPCPDSSAHNTLLSRNTAQAPAGSLSCLFIHACQIAPRSLKAPRSQGPLF